jgi:hypothetical protein
VRLAEIAGGDRWGLRTAEHEQIKALKKEVVELRSAKEALHAANLFGAEFDCRHRF